MEKKKRLIERMLNRRPLVDRAAIEEARDDGKLVVRVPGRDHPFVAEQAGAGNPKDFMGQTVEVYNVGRTSTGATVILRDSSRRSGSAPEPVFDQGESLCGSWPRMQGGSSYYVGEERTCEDGGQCPNYLWDLEAIEEISVTAGLGQKRLRGHNGILYYAQGNSVIGQDLGSLIETEFEVGSDPQSIVVDTKNSGLIVVGLGTSDGDCEAVSSSCPELAAQAAEDVELAASVAGMLDGIAEAVVSGSGETPGGSNYSPACPESDDCYCDAWNDVYDNIYENGYYDGFGGWNDGYDEGFTAGYDTGFNCDPVDDTYDGSCPGSSAYHCGGDCYSDSESVYDCAFCCGYKAGYAIGHAAGTVDGGC